MNLFVTDVTDVRNKKRWLTYIMIVLELTTLLVHYFSYIAYQI